MNRELTKTIRFIVGVPSLLVFILFSGIFISISLVSQGTQPIETPNLVSLLMLLSVAFALLFISAFLTIWALNQINKWLYTFVLISFPFASVVGMFAVFNLGFMGSFIVNLSLFLITYFAVSCYYKRAS
jgi:hypothetical protein